MPSPKADVEGHHERLLFETLGRTLHHAGVEIPDVPALGDRHVTGVSTAVDEDDAIFAEQTVGARVIDEARDEEQLVVMLAEIARQRRPVVDPGETVAGM